ncbi:MAG TPA: 2-succinyl-5-enolpyruvyl-6-hydroxy-3-cyclohexene-1-carboxylic-acid synthase [Ornithinicoccus sp.]|nr:2-succinyl-5-enolpyruvyl-6-hydroxy-3-cyclohexene-1-carboxylic-acid synthase [Ornithinicoccus sp.]
MNPSTALATVLVDELVRCGVREVVLAPGSRSAPLAYAVQQAERAGRLRLHVRVDERSAGFLALGLAKVSRRPAVVITTSGTAVANLHPAVLEAHHGAVPLIVLSADRPDELRGTGANQTTVQPGLFAGATRWEHDLPAPWPGSYAGTHAAWRARVDRAWGAALGGLGDRPGPVHLNVGFRDPLAPDLDRGEDGGDSPGMQRIASDEGLRWELPDDLAGRADGLPWTEVPSPPAAGTAASPAGTDASGRGTAHDEQPGTTGRTLMVLGDLPDPEQAAEALTVATAQGWPVVAEPFGVGDRSRVVPHGSLLLTAGDWLDAHPPDRVLVVGRCTLNRETGALLRRPGVRVEAVTTGGEWPDPSHVVQRVHTWQALADDPGLLCRADAAWAEAWQSAGARMAGEVTPRIADSWPSGPAVAQRVVSSLGDDDVLVLGSSNAARDVDRAGVAGRGLLVTANRGLAGIDGTNATAVGIALADPERRVMALMGDLTFLHDVNGLLIGPDEPHADLTIVVVNDDGGGIFGTLEYGEPERAGDFERVFGTPTGADLRSLCSAYSIGFDRVDQPDALAACLAQSTRGVRVIEVAVARGRHRELRQALTAAAAAALKGA